MASREIFVSHLMYDILFWLRCLFAVKAEFHLSPVHVGYVVDSATLGQVSFRVLRAYYVSIIPSMLYTLISFICHRHYTD